MIRTYYFPSLPRYLGTKLLSQLSKEALHKADETHTFFAQYLIFHLLAGFHEHHAAFVMNGRRNDSDGLSKVQLSRGLAACSQGRNCAFCLLLGGVDQVCGASTRLIFGFSDSAGGSHFISCP